jgi:glycosyltransferase involved in cell wall biosynthesis
MKFSLVIPVKDEERCLEETLISIRKQIEAADLPLDVIVVDGGSTDSSIDIARKYADHVIVDIQGSQSIASGRNLGVAYSNADILIHTDADVLFPNLHSLICACNVLFNDESYVAATARLLPKPSESTMIDHIMHYLCNVFIQRSIPIGAFLARGELQIVRKSAFLEVGGYDGHIIIGEDCNLFYRLKKLGNIKYFVSHHVLHSTRRFRQYGYVKTLSIYAREAAWLLVTGRNYLKTWEVVR